AVAQAQGESADLQVGDSASGGPGDIQITQPSAGANAADRAQMFFENIRLQRGSIKVNGAGLLHANNQLSITGGALDVDCDVPDLKSVQCGTLTIAAAQTSATASMQNGGKLLATSLQIGSDAASVSAA